MATDNLCFYLQNRLIQTNQTGGQQYTDTSPFSIPCLLSAMVDSNPQTQDHWSIVIPNITISTYSQCLSWMFSLFWDKLSKLRVRTRSYTSISISWMSKFCFWKRFQTKKKSWQEELIWWKNDDESFRRIWSLSYSLTPALSLSVHLPGACLSLSLCVFFCSSVTFIFSYLWQMA